MRPTKPTHLRHRTIPELAVSTSNKTAEYSHKYPLFENPREYLESRRGKYLYGVFKRWSERRAINKSLADLDNINYVCDAPCGPGRLFSYWGKRGYRVTGVDLSDPMIAAAHETCTAFNPRNVVIKGDAFSLNDSLAGERPDLVASIRFFYYFKRDKRIELLKTMAAASKKYLLVQYKTTETIRGRRRLRMFARSASPSSQQFCSNEEIREELEAAGLELIRIVPISQASDRVFVAARKRLQQEQSRGNETPYRATRHIDTGNRLLPGYADGACQSENRAASSGLKTKNGGIYQNSRTETAPMRKTGIVNTVSAVCTFLLFFVVLFSFAYATTSIVYGESTEDTQLPKFLGNKPDNINLLTASDTGPGPFSFYVVGDTKLANFFPSIYENDIRDDAPDFGLILGDFVREPKPEDHQHFLMNFPTWGIQSPLFLVCGNHDIVTRDDIGRKRSYSFTIKDFEKKYGPTDFSFTYHGCLFIVLNDIDTNGHVAYLADALSRRTKDTLMTFVFVHIPPHTISPAIKCRVMPGEKQFLSLIDEYNVDYVIGADFHSYFRCKTGDTNFIISGGGMDKMGDNTKNVNGAFHSVFLQVDPLTKDVAERVYRADGQTNIWRTVRKAAITQVFAFFENHEDWEAPVLSSTALLSILLGALGFVFVASGRIKR
jgi:SAM-dependent methyltransferase